MLYVGDDMKKKYYEKVLENFITISKKNWIKGINNTTNSVGLTFEHELNKKADSLFLPDYNGIELKCSQRFSKFPISLFSLAFDGPSLFEMDRLLKAYGKKAEDGYSLMGYLKVNEKVLINDNFFELKVDRKTKKLYVKVYDLNFNLIEEGTYIYFSSLKKRVKIKLSKLAIIWASKKTIDNNLYFRYYKIVFYELKSFDMFLKLIEEQKINIDLVGRISKSGIKKGKQRNKNFVFQIPKAYVDELFTEIYQYDIDKKYIQQNQFFIY